MSVFFTGPRIISLVIAIAVLGLAVAAILWVGRLIRGELDSSGARGTDRGEPEKPRLAPPAAQRKAPVARTQAAPAASPALPDAPVARVAPATPVLPADIPQAMRAMLDAEKPRFWCPMCGAELQLPTFPPLVSRCANCGKKSVIRAEEGGRYVVIVSPPPKLG